MTSDAVTIPMPASSALLGLQLRVKLTGARRMRARFIVGTLMMRVAARIIGMSAKIEVEAASDV